MITKIKVKKFTTEEMIRFGKACYKYGNENNIEEMLNDLIKLGLLGHKRYPKNRSRKKHNF